MSAPKFSTTQWLIIIIASIGFLFDTYELLMTPLAAPPAIAELLNVPLSHPSVTKWTGNLLWLSALCGGVFGLMGGWLTDRLGRKFVMSAAIFIYSLSPVAAAFSTTLEMFVFFRCTTFIGVCVEFVAAITWLSEVFEDKKQRERWLGITQAFASVGGLFVTSINLWIISHGKDLPHLGLPLLNNATDPSSWRYLLMTGFFPAIPIALMLPFVPESKVWRERRASGTMKRPSFGALFSPELRRTTLVTAALSACAYGIAFGALQLTPLRISPGLPEVADHGKAMGPLRAEAAKLSEAFVAAPADSPERAELLTKLKENRAAQEPHDKAIKQVGSKIQLAQEFGGLTGRILLAVLLVVAITRRSLLRLFVLPGLIVAPLTYFYLFHQGATAFSFGMALCGLLVVAQFSYFGEFLPKVFPIHLRGTGGSFATNVGGRMIGTSMAFVTSTMVAPMISGDPARVLPMHIAKAAGIVAVTMFGIAFLLSFFLPEPKEEAAKE